MNRFITITTVILVIATMSGCTGMGYMSVPSVPGSTTREVRPVVFLQRGVNLQVFNNCSNEATLYPSHPMKGQEQVAIPPGPPIWIPMAPNILEMSRGLTATIVFYEKGITMGTISRSFRIDRNSTQRVQWILGGDRGGGGQNVYIDRCPKSLDRTR